MSGVSRVISAPVETSAGRVRGFVEDGVRVFRGIPYGADTGGANRFRPANPAASWSGVLDAMSWGYDAPQPHRGPAQTAVAELFGNATRQRAQREDCLWLNVWTPAADDARRPVVVWFHGGGFARGSSSAAGEDGAALAAHGDVVVVSMNHRLNTLGCTYLDHLDPDLAGSGNLSMLDLQLALEWVRDNVGAFGGDPDSVTLWGWSGGGQKISGLMSMPSARGLFHRAIVQSGTNPKMLEPSEAIEHTTQLFHHLGLREGDIEGLRALPSEALIDAWSAISYAPPYQVWGLPARFSPVADGVLIHHHPDEVAAITLNPEVPVLIGSTTHEMSHWMQHWHPGAEHWDVDAAVTRFRDFVGDTAPELFAAYQKLNPELTPWELFTRVTAEYPTRTMSIRQAELRGAAGVAPTWLYRFDFVSPALGGLLGAPHGLDVPLAFRNVDVDAALNGGGHDAHRMSEELSADWLAFVRTGRPADSEWAPYDTARRATKLFDHESRVVDDPAREARELMAARLLRD